MAAKMTSRILKRKNPTTETALGTLLGTLIPHRLNPAKTLKAEDLSPLAGTLQSGGGRFDLP